MNKLDFIITSDGTHTLFHPTLNETYHSINGARQESEHVYIKNGYHLFEETQDLTILEVGFGTGLNLWLTLLEFLKENNSRKIYYTTLELYPLDKQIINELNYVNSETEKNKKLFQLIHSVPWEQEIEVLPNFVIEKKAISIHEFISTQKFNLIYFDAFAPDKQSDMWEKSIFYKLYSYLENGVLSTYCAKGSVKRLLKEVGFDIESIPGPPGKFQMTLAWNRQI